MRIDGKDIDYVKLKDSYNTKTNVQNIEEGFTIFRAFIFIGTFIMLSYMFMTEAPYKSFFYNFNFLDFLKCLMFEPYETFSIITASLVSFFIDICLVKLEKWIRN